MSFAKSPMICSYQSSPAPPLPTLVLKDTVCESRMSATSRSEWKKRSAKIHAIVQRKYLVGAGVGEGVGVGVGSWARGRWAVSVEC